MRNPHKISRNFKSILNLRNKVIECGRMTNNLSDGALEFMVEDYGYEYTRNYLKGLL